MTHTIAPTTLRRVWAHVSRYPAMSCAERGAVLGMASSTVWWALRRLAAAGYIVMPPPHVRGVPITVNIPLMVPDSAGEEERTDGSRGGADA
jgi:hypothetical protein